MGIEEKPGIESETCEESQTKVKVFLKEKLGLETEEITTEKYNEMRLLEDQVYINEDFCEYKRIKEIREKGEFAKIVYNRLVLY